MHLQSRIVVLLSTLLTLTHTLSTDQTTLTAPKSPKDIRHRLKHASIIPTVLDDFRPSCLLHVSYISHQRRLSVTATTVTEASAGAAAQVEYGNTISPNDTTHEPVIQIECTKQDLSNGFDEDDRTSQSTLTASNFTIALTDPDAPSRTDPKWSEMCHWIATVSWDGVLVPILDYKPPGPPSGTGEHRYVFVLMRGDTTNLTGPAERRHWGFGEGKAGQTLGVRDWAREQGLEVVGANWFVAEHED